MQLTSTGGSIVADDAAVIFGTNPVVIADGDVDLQIEGDLGSLNISLEAISMLRLYLSTTSPAASLLH